MLIYIYEHKIKGSESAFFFFFLFFVFFFLLVVSYYQGDSFQGPAKEDHLPYRQQRPADGKHFRTSSVTALELCNSSHTPDAWPWLWWEGTASFSGHNFLLWVVFISLFESKVLSYWVEFCFFFLFLYVLNFLHVYRFHHHCYHCCYYQCSISHTGLQLKSIFIVRFVDTACKQSWTFPECAAFSSHIAWLIRNTPLSSQNISVTGAAINHQWST